MGFKMVMFLKEEEEEEEAVVLKIWELVEVTTTMAVTELKKVEVNLVESINSFLASHLYTLSDLGGFSPVTGSTVRKLGLVVYVVGLAQSLLTNPSPSPNSPKLEMI